MKSFLIDMYVRSSVAVWGGAFLFLGWKAIVLILSYFGLDSVDYEKDLDIIIVVLVSAVLIGLFSMGALLGCLISYITVARIFRVPEECFRKLLEEVLIYDKREKLMKKYYLWCINIAYQK